MKFCDYVGIIILYVIISYVTYKKVIIMEIKWNIFLSSIVFNGGKENKMVYGRGCKGQDMILWGFFFIKHICVSTLPQ